MKKIQKYTHRLNIRLEESQNKEMEKACKKYNISVAEFIRISIELSINKAK